MATEEATIPIPPAHPTRCDPAHAAADPAADTTYPGAKSGAHRATPIHLHLPGALWSWTPARIGDAFLSQAAAPWTCGVYLRIHMDDGPTPYMPLDEARTEFQTLAALLVQGQAR